MKFTARAGVRVGWSINFSGVHVWWCMESGWCISCIDTSTSPSKPGSNMHLDVVKLEDAYFELTQMAHISNVRPRFGWVCASSKVSLGKCISIRSGNEVLQNSASAKNIGGDHQLGKSVTSGKSGRQKGKTRQTETRTWKFWHPEKLWKNRKMGRNKTFLKHRSKRPS